MVEMPLWSTTWTVKEGRAWLMGSVEVKFYRSKEGEWG
jgi:hypothetical protein